MTDLSHNAIFGSVLFMKYSMAPSITKHYFTLLNINIGNATEKFVIHMFL